MTNKTAHEIVMEAIEYALPLCGGLSIANDKAQSLLYKALAILGSHAVVPREPSEEELNPVALNVRERIGIEFGTDDRGSLGYYKRIFLAGYGAMIAAATEGEKK